MLSKIRGVKGAVIVLLILALLAFVFSSIFNSTSSRKGSIKKPKSQVEKATEFTKEGELHILSTENDTVVSIDIELATDQYEIARGMMFRREMGDLEGMLFIMPTEQIQSFWMKNCYLSLDMIFADSKGIIGSAQTYTEPYSMKSLPSEKPSKYVLETKAGFWDKHQIKPGYKMVFNAL
ncbi:DUF192 domain-containing protein [Luteibaculum oceani]|uniref:DUF192 domain-containing protein n=1 Tax=Luteibaculum oceani TaxID=1294296 RepID=A0A5C6V4N2_9FLAO|nr:DUF192 domain-containing protein [Luteibaculum oceani]TXC78465.1 DUF192 domain-containing protein [Luteibaculum oceani]